MLSFKPSKEIITKLQELTNQFAQTYAFLMTLSKEERLAMHRYARISMIGASTRIENAQLTDTEIDWMDTVLTNDAHITAFEENRYLIENKLSKDKERSIEEVAGCRMMLHTVYEQGGDFFPLTESVVRALHKELLRYYTKAGPNVGRYKRQPNYVVEKNQITGKERVVFKTADAGPITETAMAELIAWYNNSIKQEASTIAVACEFVFRFLAIHPFQDGNGRLARGMFLIALMASPYDIISHVAPYLPIDRHIEMRRAEYYLVLNKCSSGVFHATSKKYKIEYFLVFMIKVLGEALDGIKALHLRHEKIRALSQAADRVLQCFREHPEIRLTTKDIEAETSLPRRTIVHALSHLLDAQLLQRYGKGAGTRYQLIF